MSIKLTGLLETPFTSLLKHLPAFRALLQKPQVDQCRTDSCMLGSIHQKSFRFLSVHADLTPLRVRCDGSHVHVPIQGSYTKKSATYTPLLAARLAQVLAAGIEEKKAFMRGVDSKDLKGLESQLVNSVALSADWIVDAVWDFKKLAHINILEFSVLERLAKRLAKIGLPVRATCLVDSKCRLCCLCKRSHFVDWTWPCASSFLCSLRRLWFLLFSALRAYQAQRAG